MHIDLKKKDMNRLILTHSKKKEGNQKRYDKLRSRNYKETTR